MTRSQISGFACGDLASTVSNVSPAVLRRSLWQDVQYVVMRPWCADGGVVAGPAVTGRCDCDCGNTHVTAPSQRTATSSSLFFTTLDLDRGLITGAGGGGGGKKLEETKIPAAPGVDHMRNWMECLRSRKQPNADIEAGYSHSVALAMAVRSLHTGRRVLFDAKKQRLTSG